MQTQMLSRSLKDYQTAVHTILETTFMLSTTLITVTVPSSTTTVTVFPGMPDASSNGASPRSSSLPQATNTFTSATSSPSAPITLPLVATSSAANPTSETSHSSTSPTGSGVPSASETGPPEIAQQARSYDRKAVIGGLSGSIAGLLFIGVLLCFCLRRRRKSKELQEISEPGVEQVGQSLFSTAAEKPSLVRHFSDFAALGFHRNISAPELPKPKTPSPVDGSLIRVPVDHWDRPFAAGGGLRDSITTPVPLRVANPDPSRSNTPPLAARSALLQHQSSLRVVVPDLPRSKTPQPGPRPGLLRKQSSQLAAFLRDRSKGAMVLPVPDNNEHTPVPPPILHIEPALSREWLVHDPYTHRLRNSPSETTLPIIVQHPPDDPFVDENPRGMPTMQDPSPTLPITEWTMRHNNFHPQTPQVPWIGLPIYSTFSSGALDVHGRQHSMQSVSDMGHTVRSTASDQFDLAVSPSGTWDSSVARVSTQGQATDARSFDSQASPNYRVYEGT